MRTCNEIHSDCRAQKKPVLPTRVLDISVGDHFSNPRLLISNGQAARYACLSYCWGPGAQPISLTSETLPGYTENIPLTRIPQSIQDAIFVSRKLGLRYLWIDSLCILQDSPEDKARKISQMGQIYSSADITISAASANDCQSGFLGKRHSWWNARDGPPIRLPYLCPDGAIGAIHLVRFGSASSQEPLHLRAWPFQEHMLSPRLLTYGAEQIFWRCSKDRFLKNGGVTQAPEISDLDSLKDCLILGERQPKHYDWLNLVHSYSLRKQSISDDRINAIRGMVSLLHPMMEDEYIAGFWKSWILSDLLWTRVGQKKHQPTRNYPS